MQKELICNQDWFYVDINTPCIWAYRFTKRVKQYSRKHREAANIICTRWILRTITYFIHTRSDSWHNPDLIAASWDSKLCRVRILLSHIQSIWIRSKQVQACTACVKIAHLKEAFQRAKILSLWSSTRRKRMFIIVAFRERAIHRTVAVKIQKAEVY